jgi:hypothetical protein
VRDGTIGMIVGPDPAIDIQAALTVIGRRADALGLVNLIQVEQPPWGLDLRGANLTRANLSRQCPRLR